jgi:hypothetical protein
MYVVERKRQRLPHADIANLIAGRWIFDDAGVSTLQAARAAVRSLNVTVSARSQRASLGKVADYLSRGDRMNPSTRRRFIDAALRGFTTGELDKAALTSSSFDPEGLVPVVVPTVIVTAVAAVTAGNPIELEELELAKKLLRGSLPFVNKLEPLLTQEFRRVRLEPIEDSVPPFGALLVLLVGLRRWIVSAVFAPMPSASDRVLWSTFSTSADRALAKLFGGWPVGSLEVLAAGVATAFPNLSASVDTHDSKAESRLSMSRAGRVVMRGPRAAGLQLGRDSGRWSRG